jgi:membrane-bound lytic murein transglycosylase A
MNTRISNAPSASSNKSHMRAAYKRGIALLMAGALWACSTRPVDITPPTDGLTIDRPIARWQRAAWSELPGWEVDRTADAWAALQRSCEKPPAEAGWPRLCVDALQFKPSDDAAARRWLMQRLDPWRVLPRVLPREGSAPGLATGYFEPLLDASRVSRATHRTPLYAPPADLATRKPWYTRAETSTLPAALSALRGKEIAYVADPLDALIVQIQGSGRARITEADGRITNARLAFAGHNDQPYMSVGRWLIEQGQLKAGEASWPAIKDWARKNPQRVTEMLNANPRLVFFKEEPAPLDNAGPRGSQNVPLTPERSIAVDVRSIPLGTPVWLDTTEPLSATPLRRLVMAQDTGSAITGAVRADYFWGPGERAEAMAGRMKQPLAMWVLWPK